MLIKENYYHLFLTYYIFRFCLTCEEKKNKFQFNVQECT